MILNVKKMRVALLTSIVSILLYSQTSSFGQCNPIPKADFKADSICETDSMTFVNLSQNAETYLWKFGDGKISTQHSPKHFYPPELLHKGPVTLVARHSNGCADSINKPIFVYSNPSSNYSFTINQNEINFKAPYSWYKSYRWYFGNGDSASDANPNYTFSKIGKYTVCLKVIAWAANCFSETCKEVSVPSGILYTIEPKIFKIYPVPNSGSFTIEKPETKEIFTIEIFNPIGQIVANRVLIGEAITLSLDLSNGIYLVRFTNGDTSLNQRIIVSK